MPEIIVPNLTKTHRKIAADTISMHTGFDGVALRGAILYFEDGAGQRAAIEKFMAALVGVSKSLRARIEVACGQENEDW